MTPVLRAGLALLVLAPLHDLFRRPAVRWLALRNIARRRSEAVLVVGGAMLATALIGTSIIVGATFERSIRDIARTNLGEIDEVITLDAYEDLAGAVAAIEVDVADIDGLIGATRTTAVLLSADGTGAERERARARPPRCPRLRERSEGNGTLRHRPRLGRGAHRRGRRSGSVPGDR